MTGLDHSKEYRQLEQAIAALDAQRALLGNDVVEAAIGPMRRKLAELELTSKIEIQVEGERKLVTVLFADISGFTTLSEQQDPESVRELVNTCFVGIVPIIEKYEGTVGKFIGDEILTIFGAPIAHENDPERALLTALDMLNELASFNLENQVNIGLHIGISTGLVIAGSIGSAGQEQFGVLGEPVNLAKRLVDNAEEGNIFVGPNTYKLTAAGFNYATLEPLQSKGKSEPIHIHALERAKPLLFHPNAGRIHVIGTHMIGRDDELAAIQDLFDRAFRDEQTTLVTIIGEAGIGKSRLLSEFENWILEGHKEINILRGRCCQQKQGATNSLVRDLFADGFGIVENDAIRTVRLKLEKGIAAILPRDGVTKAHYLGAWLGFDYSHSPYVAALENDAEQLYNRVLLHLGQIFSVITEEKPTAILLDDIHWADNGSLNALVDLCRRKPELPLFILCLARPGLLKRRTDWGKDLLDTSYEQITLDPLAESEIRALGSEITQKIPQAPPSLINLLVNRSEGNPYFLEEIVQMFIDQGVICTDGETWRVAVEKLADFQVPATLTAVLQTRLDRLPPTHKQTLQQAAVVGRIFWDAILAELGMDTDNQLLDLSKRELIVPRQQSTFAGTSEYLFKHELLRDVTYKSLLKRVRRSYHLVVGRWLVKIAEVNGRTDEYAAIIGGHFEAADEQALAAEWYGQAGKLAALQFDQEAAVDWLSRALILTPEDKRTTRYELLMSREKVHHLNGEREKQAEDLAALRRLVGLSGETGELPPEFSARVLNRQAAYAMALSDFPAAITAAAEALIRANAAQDGRLAAAALSRWGNALSRQGMYEAARERHITGQAQAEAAGAQAELASNLRGLGNTVSGQGDAEGARTYYKAAMEITKEIGDRRGESICLNNLGVSAFTEGNYIEALEYYEAALEIAKEVGDRRVESSYLNNIGFVADIHGDFNQAKASCEAALEITREIGDRRGQGICLNNLGVIAFAQDDYSRARKNYLVALSLRQEVGDKPGEGLVLHNMGMLTQAEGNLDEAETYFKKALTIRRALDLPQYIVEDQVGLAGLALKQGNILSAYEALTPVISYLEENPSLEGTEHPARVLLICGQVLLAAGKQDQARGIIEGAFTRFETMAEKLPTSAQREQFWQAPDYAALRQLYLETITTHHRSDQV